MSDLSRPNEAGASVGPSSRTFLLYLIGVAGLAFSITLMFIEMRAVLDVGGSCADGGPYVSAQSCPDGTWLMFLAIFGGFGWGALALWAGSLIGGRYGLVPLLAWPGLFCSLGFNFLQYGVTPPGGGGPELGFLIPGILFELMGGIPLALGLRFGGSVDSAAQERLRATRVAAGLAPDGALPDVSTTSFEYPTLVEAPSGSRAAEPAVRIDLANELERIADLHARGALTDEEFATAKTALLASAGPSSEGEA
ncbi:MAG TPA: SHOCT domain-containing protein [Candidatus Limnocylindrales bacterium]